MKKFFLIVITLLPTLLSAQNGVTISNFSVGSGKVTFDISWNRGGMPILWRDSVWVFVDYNNAGVMTRLPLLTAGATLTTTSAPGIGKVEAAPDNNKQGVWVIGNAKVAASGSFSATVALPFSGSNVSGACVYASNYPPYGTWVNSGTQLSLSGTAPYTLHLQGPTELHPVILGNTYDLPVGYSMSSFTDATGAPGLVNCTPPTAPESLTSSTTTVCSGGLVTLTANGGQPGSASQFEWGTGAVVGSGNFAVTAIGSTTATPISATTYWVRRVSTDGCGPTDAATVSVAVNALPTVSSSTGGARCGTGTVVLSAASDGAVIDWYAELTGGAVLSGGTGTNSFTTPSISTSTTYYAQARNTGTSCLSASRTAVLAAVNTVPTTPVITQPQSVCQGSDLVFTINSPLTGGSYSWTGSGTASGAGSVTYTVSGATTGAKTVTANVTIAANGITCTSLESEKVSATVDNLPTVATTVNGARCGTGAVLISATPSGGAEIDWYADLLGGSALTTASNTYTTPSINTSTTYYAEARVGSCIAAAPRIAILATVNTFPTIDTQPTSSQTVCPGSVSLSVTATNASAYQWKQGDDDATGTGATAAAFTGTVSVNSTFTVVVAGEAGCSVTSTPALVTMKTSGCCNAPGETVAVTAFAPCAGAATGATWTVLDTRDGDRSYKIVMMPDNRVWFAQNLNFQAGLTFQSNANQPSTGNGASCIGSFWCPGVSGAVTSSQSTCDIYGALYTWETAMMPDGKFNASVTAWSEAWVSGNYFASGAPGTTANAKVNVGRTDAGAADGRGICPSGWHVPTDYEWAYMLDKVDGSTVFTDQTGEGWAGSNAPAIKLKSSATTSGSDMGDGKWLYYASQYNGTNSTGFNVLPAGRRYAGTVYHSRALHAFFWSSSRNSADLSWSHYMHPNNNMINRLVASSAEGYSVRCLKN